MTATHNDAWVSDLEVNDESVRAIMLSIAAECQEAAALRGVSREAIELQLGVCLGELDGELAGLLSIRPVPAENASDLLAIRIGFSPAGYRRLAEAAKDWIAHIVDGDGDRVVVGHGNSPTGTEPGQSCDARPGGVESKGDTQ